MKLFGKRNSNKQEKSKEQEIKQEVPAELRDELLNALKEDPKLVFDIEGADKNVRSGEQTEPLTLEGEELLQSTEAQEKHADNDALFIRQLHALLQEEDPQSTDSELQDSDPEPAPDETQAPSGASEPDQIEEQIPVLNLGIHEAPDSDSESVDEEQPDKSPEVVSDREKPAGTTAEEAFSEGSSTIEPQEEKAPSEDSAAFEENSTEITDNTETLETNGSNAENGPILPAQTVVTYESVADAVTRAIAAEDHEGSRSTRAPIDDDTLLAELYALIGGADGTKKTETSDPAEDNAEMVQPQSEQESESDVVEAASVEELPVPQAVEAEQPEAEEPEELYEEPEEVEELSGAPGWVKGMFLLLLSLLLSGMTFYAVAADVLGKLF